MHEVVAARIAVALEKISDSLAILAHPVVVGVTGVAVTGAATTPPLLTSDEASVLDTPDAEVAGYIGRKATKK